MPRDQRGERQFTGFVAAGRKSFQQFLIRQAGRHTVTKQALELISGQTQHVVLSMALAFPVIARCLYPLMQPERETNPDDSDQSQIFSRPRSTSGSLFSMIRWI